MGIGGDVVGVDAVVVDDPDGAAVGVEVRPDVGVVGQERRDHVARSLADGPVVGARLERVVVKAVTPLVVVHVSDLAGVVARAAGAVEVDVAVVVGVAGGVEVHVGREPVLVHGVLGIRHEAPDPHVVKELVGVDLGEGRLVRIPGGGGAGRCHAAVAARAAVPDVDVAAGERHGPGLVVREGEAPVLPSRLAAAVAAGEVDQGQGGGRVAAVHGARVVGAVDGSGEEPDLVVDLEERAGSGVDEAHPGAERGLGARAHLVDEAQVQRAVGLPGEHDQARALVGVARHGGRTIELRDGDRGDAVDLGAADVLPLRVGVDLQHEDRAEADAHVHAAAPDRVAGDVPVVGDVPGVGVRGVGGRPQLERRQVDPEHAALSQERARGLLHRVRRGHVGQRDGRAPGPVRGASALVEAGVPALTETGGEPLPRVGVPEPGLDAGVVVVDPVRLRALPGVGRGSEGEGRGRGDVQGKQEHGLTLDALRMPHPRCSVPRIRPP